MAALFTAAAKYEAALDKKFGKGDERSILEMFGKPNLAECHYEARGAIREVKEIGKDRAIVTVWTKGRFANDADRIHERKFTAAKVDGQWKFQLTVPYGGTPVVKMVKRTGPDGKIVEVYAEHEYTEIRDEKTWKELKPSTYDGAEEEIKLEAELFARFAERISTQMEEVQKGSYQTRKEALDPLEKAFRELIERARNKLKQEKRNPAPRAIERP
jgi:hypothetical protein